MINQIPPNRKLVNLAACENLLRITCFVCVITVIQFMMLVLSCRILAFVVILLLLDRGGGWESRGTKEILETFLRLFFPLFSRPSATTEKAKKSDLITNYHNFFMGSVGDPSNVMRIHLREKVLDEIENSKISKEFQALESFKESRAESSTHDTNQAFISTPIKHTLRLVPTVPYHIGTELNHNFPFRAQHKKVPARIVNGETILMP